MSMENRVIRAHVLVLPFPAQGHISPMLRFANRLVSKGVKVTLATTIFTSKSIQTELNSSLDVEVISDGFDEGGYAQAESPEAYLTTFRSQWAFDVAKQLGVHGVVFFTQSCAVNSIYYHVHKGFIQLPLSGSKILLPGLPLLEPSETPSSLYFYGYSPAWFDVVMNQFSNIDEADWVLFNSFYELEKEVVDWMSKLWKVGTIGPSLPSLHLDTTVLEANDKDYELNLFNPNSNTCMSWLSDKPNGSVVYVSFGSMVELEMEQMQELAWGLIGSNCYFLWVVRESEEAKLPANFIIEEKSRKGMVVKWCPQLKVLAHESIGCFVTHCGFNSVIEALSFGIPMVAMPQWTDQFTNAKYVVDIWGTGIRAQPDETGTANREVIALCLKALMEGEKGKEVKKNANKWKILAREAIDEGGSSDTNIDEFVSKLLDS
ncbi:UDP-glucuronosyl/UDP-glucosyltransferase [Corchorus olitorius]|uniref:Glycosyltransferase n=1 Tax=Corchorus olitorius TaxID=93759 RepID=A0A1R3ILB3_9ROSI|nr:UDP-glucuronosyl/UDP-glucosyltransferase [Corchorus olitorius]